MAGEGTRPHESTERPSGGPGHHTGTAATTSRSAAQQNASPPDGTALEQLVSAMSNDTPPDTVSMAPGGTDSVEGPIEFDLRRSEADASIVGVTA